MHALFDPMLSSLPMVRADKLRAVAVTGAERSPLLADVPSMREQGQKNFEFYSWYGLWGPAKLPAPVVRSWKRRRPRSWPRQGGGTTRRAGL